VEAEAILSLDVSESEISNMKGIEKFIHLDTLYCQVNPLAGLDISNLASLKYLDCRGCGLHALDVSQCIELTDLHCGIKWWDLYNYLTSLDVSHNPALQKLDCSFNPLTSLGEVCVWTMPFPPEGLDLDITGSPNVYFTTDCSQ
jgi:Leucine-rich repeat (LRR) protein